MSEETEQRAELVLTTSFTIMEALHILWTAICGDSVRITFPDIKTSHWWKKHHNSPPRQIKP